MTFEYHHPNYYKKLKPKKKLIDGIHDLWSRDITELILARRYKEALSVGKYLGVPVKEIEKLIAVYKTEKSKEEQSKNE